MNAGTLVFRDEVTPIRDLVAQAQENPLRLSLDEVTVEEPGHPIEGENWRPQLAPYKPWVHDAALDETDELEGTDGDLLIVGALGMGITDEERMALIGDAVHGEGAAGTEEGAADVPARALTPHELWTLGQTPRWNPGQSQDEASSITDSAALCETLECRETSNTIRSQMNRYRETSENSCETTEELSASLAGELAGGSTGGLGRGDVGGLRGGAAGESEDGQAGEPGEDALRHFALNVPLTVRRDGEGFAVSAVHLAALAENGLPADNLIVVVPSYIDDAPVKRIASEAFARRYTSGVQVRLLVVPDTVEVVGAQAFGSVCAETISLGARVHTYDPAPLDMALPNPRLERRRYLVSAANERLAVRGGCLLERLGEAAGAAGPSGKNPQGSWRLLFAEAPAPERLAISQGVRVVGSAAFAKGCPPPRVLDTPGTLERVDGTVHPETIWRGADLAALARIVQRCGGRVTDFDAVEQDGCWYDFADGAARLVAGPPAPDSVSRQFSSAAHARVRGGAALSPREIAAEAAVTMAAPASAADRLALPRAVEGAPLAVIAERALITAPATLVLPDTVRTVRDGNACKGTRKLMLPEGLRTIGAHCFCSRTLVGPVLIPASVTSIGEGSFEYAVVRLAAVDAVVHITSDQLMSCFLEAPDDGIPFDFARYDDQLLVGRGLPDHLGALLHRVAAPFRLAPAMRDRIVEALRERAADAVAAVAREGDIACVRALAEAGFLDDGELFDRQIERLRASNRTDCVLFLMNWQHDRAEASRATVPKRARDRFAL